MKAKLCVRGRQMLYGYCASHGVTSKRLGKLLVATDEDQVMNLIITRKTDLAMILMDLGLILYLCR